MRSRLSASTKPPPRRSYAKAGGDIIFIESPETETHMMKIGSALDVPLLSNQLHGGRTPILPQAQLKEMGFSVAIYPAAGLFAGSHALASVYASLAKGKPVEASLYAFDDFVEMIGFQLVWDFEKKYADLLVLKAPRPGPRSPRFKSFLFNVSGVNHLTTRRPRLPSSGVHPPQEHSGKSACYYKSRGYPSPSAMTPN